MKVIKYNTFLKHFRCWDEKFPKVTDTKVNFYYSKLSFQILFHVIIYGIHTPEIKEWVESFLSIV